MNFIKIKENLFINLNNVCDIEFSGLKVNGNESCWLIFITYIGCEDCVRIRVDGETYARIESFFNKNKTEVL